MTSRGLKEAGFEQSGEFLHESILITLSIQKEHGKLLKDLNKGSAGNKDIENIKVEVADIFFVAKARRKQKGSQISKCCQQDNQHI